MSTCRPASKAIVFDLGKVLVDFDFNRVVDRLLPRCRYAETALKPIIGQETSLLPKYETGQIDTEGFFEEARAISGFQGSLEEFSEIFGNIFWPIEAMVSLQNELKCHGYPTFIFSNTNELAVRYISQFPFFHKFEAYILSYEHGVLKPDSPIYEVVERVTGRTGDSLIYIDDRHENVATGDARGWYSIRHETPEKTRKALDRILV